MEACTQDAMECFSLISSNVYLKSNQTPLDIALAIAKKAVDDKKITNIEDDPIVKDIKQHVAKAPKPQQ